MSWSLGVALLGAVLAVPFRSFFILRERLRFPGNFSTAVLVGALHQDEDVAKIIENDRNGLHGRHHLTETQRLLEDDQ